MELAGTVGDRPEWYWWARSETGSRNNGRARSETGTERLRMAIPRSERWQITVPSVGQVSVLVRPHAINLLSKTKAPRSR